MNISIAATVMVPGEAENVIQVDCLPRKGEVIDMYGVNIEVLSVMWKQDPYGKAGEFIPLVLCQRIGE